MSFDSKSSPLRCFVLCCCWLFSAADPARLSAQEALVESSLPTLTNSIGMKLVQIPAGRFSMGSPASEPGSEEHEVLHKVELTQPYYLGITEVTERQWALVMEDAFWTEESEDRDKETNRLVRKVEVQIRNPKLDSQLPITNISYDQAVEFCERLGQLPEEKKEGRHYRLPTEAEWEHACRAGTASAYSFGDDRSMLGTYGWLGGSQPRAVGLKLPNAWGLYDMHGNAAEWCFDYYGSYSKDLVVDPIGPEQLLSLERVFRGGSFDGKVSECRSGWRGKANPRSSDDNKGFRIVLGSNAESITRPKIHNSIGQQMVAIPAGRFLMGIATGDRNQRPGRSVSLTHSFRMSATEVSQSQWRAVMGTTPWRGQPNVTEGDDYPATYVSWEEAAEFCRRLSMRPEESALGRVYRLPTEAEWEYACRGGSSTRYYFGDNQANLHQFACYGRKTQGPLEIGARLPNAFGLYDMHGNVSEWCNDWFAENPPTEAIDPAGPLAASQRVIRGGSWSSKSETCGSAARDSNPLSFRFDYVGFRVVLTPPRINP